MVRMSTNSAAEATVAFRGRLFAAKRNFARYDNRTGRAGWVYSAPSQSTVTMGTPSPASPSMKCERPLVVSP